MKKIKFIKTIIIVFCISLTEIKSQPVNASINSLSLNISLGIGADVNSIAWSPNGMFLGVASETANGLELRIYEYEPSLNILAPVTNTSHGAALKTLVWSPNGIFIAVGGETSNGSEIAVYQFNATFASLDITSTFSHGATVRTLTWSPDGQYIGYGADENSANQEGAVLAFNSAGLAALPNATISNGADSILGNDFSANGPYLAIGGTPDSSSNEIQIFRLKNNTLTAIPGTQLSFGMTSTAVNSVEFDYSGYYLGVGGNNGDFGNQIAVYSFDGTNLTNLPGTDVNHGAAINSVAWDPNGLNLAVGGEIGTNSIDTRVYSFNNSLGSQSLTEISGCDVAHGATVNSVAWSPNMKYIATGGATAPDGNQVRIYQVNFNPIPQPSTHVPVLDNLSIELREKYGNT